jgi:hypothetical protein
MRRMPLELTDSELATAATACRAMAYQEGKRAEAMENRTTRGPVEAASQRYGRLAEKLEAARKRNHPRRTQSHHPRHRPLLASNPWFHRLIQSAHLSPKPLPYNSGS